MINIITFDIPSSSRWQSCVLTLDTTLHTVQHVFLTLPSNIPWVFRTLCTLYPHCSTFPTSPMAFLDGQLAQAIAAITMLSNSMVAIQQQISVLIQNVAVQQQRMLQPITPTPLSPLNILLSLSHHLHCNILVLISKGCMCFHLQPIPKNQRLPCQFISQANKMIWNHLSACHQQKGKIYT